MKKPVFELTYNEAKSELDFLKEELKRHDELYYNKVFPEISDWEYDELRRRLNEIEDRFEDLKTKDSPSQKIGAKISTSTFSKIIHKTPMLSLDNAFSKEDMQNFIEKAANFLNLSPDVFEFCGEHKIDGLSASIFYKNGELAYSATRGDGYIGEDITENIKTLSDVPKYIDFSEEIEIRGEVYMPIKSFKDLNEKREISGEQLFANPRNAAAGSLRQIDPNITKSRNLKFFAYYVNSFEKDLNLKTQIDIMELLKKLGFKTAEYKLCKSLDDIMDYYTEISAKRSLLKYEIDGTAFKINSLELQNRLGFVGRTPRHSIAFKFPAEEAKTKIRDIIVSVGRTGKITPVAILEPVNLNGAMVSKATLHNFNEIERKQIAIGDTVKILRSGDVIPKIIAVIKKSENSTFSTPISCPSCGSSLIKYPNLIDLYCPNHYGCISQVVRYISYFVSKNCFDISGLGEKQIKEFYEEGRIKTAIDIFKLKEKESISPLFEKEGWGKVSAEKLYQAIDNSKNISFPKFIVSLGIPGVGEIISQILADKFENIYKLTSAKKSELIKIDGLGEMMADEIYLFFQNEININFINDLVKYITITPYKKKEIKDKTSKFYNKTMAFTGTLSKISRAEAKQLATSKGAVITSAISNKTDIVIVGENPGSKLKKAIELNIKILTEEEFLKNVR